MTVSAEINRLTLRVERSAQTHLHLKTLLAAAAAALAGYRQELRDLEARQARGTRRRTKEI